MANIKKDNPVYNRIQLPTNLIPDENNSIILYANKFSGFKRVDMPEELANLFDSDYGEVGNNLLVQLNQKVQYLPGGPWYVDSRDGVIYIHNRKRNRAIKTYTYKGGNGELLSIDFSIQYITKTLHGSVGMGITPEKKLSADVCENMSETKTKKDYTKSFKDYLYDEKLFGNRTNQVAISEASKDYLNNKLSYQQYTLVLGHYDKDQTIHSNMSNWGSVLQKMGSDEATIKKENIKNKHHSIEKEYQTYLAKGGNREATDYLEKESIKKVLSTGNLEPEVDRIVTQLTSGTLNGKARFFRNLKEVALLGEGQLEEYIHECFDGSTHTFDENTWKDQPYEYKEVYVDPTEYYEYDPKLHTQLRPNSNKTQISQDKEFKAKVGFQRLKEGIDEDVVVIGELEPYTVRETIEGGYRSSHVNTQKYKVKVFRRAKKNMTVPQYQVFTSFFTRKFGPAGSWEDVEKRIQALSNQNKRVTERKLVCKMTCIGNPDLETSQIINIQNVGKKWSGAWYIKSCTHQMSAGTGYNCMLELVKHRGSIPTRVTSGSVDTSNISNQAMNSKPNKEHKEPVKTSAGFNMTMTHDEMDLLHSTKSDAEKLELVMTMMAGRDRDKRYDKFGVVTHKANTSTTGKHTTHRLEVNKKIKLTNEDRKKYFRPANEMIKKYHEQEEK